MGEFNEIGLRQSEEQVVGGGGQQEGRRRVRRAAGTSWTTEPPPDIKFALTGIAAGSNEGNYCLEKGCWPVVCPEAGDWGRGENNHSAREAGKGKGDSKVGGMGWPVKEQGQMRDNMGWSMEGQGQMRENGKTNQVAYNAGIVIQPEEKGWRHRMKRKADEQKTDNKVLPTLATWC